jgi:hypothetical protein
VIVKCGSLDVELSGDCDVWRRPRARCHTQHALLCGRKENPRRPITEKEMGQAKAPVLVCFLFA